MAALMVQCVRRTIISITLTDVKRNSIVTTRRLHRCAGVNSTYRCPHLLLRCGQHTVPVGLRYNSGNVTAAANDLLPPVENALPPDYIPEPPPIPHDITTMVHEPVTAAEILQAAGGEPSLISQGLGGWSPTGIVQHALDYLHLGLDLPWWAAIALATVVVRTVMFPLVIFIQKNVAHMSYHLQGMQELQSKISESRNSGDSIKAAQYTHELVAYMKDNNVKPLKNMIAPFIQAPVFISFFIGLRQMATLPVESMKTGGMLWFENLTISDPYLLLPLICSCTLYATLELGTDGMQISNQQVITRTLMRGLPVVLFPIMMNFNAAILCYWVTSNMYSLVQVVVIRYQPVREFLRIPKIHKPSAPAVQEKNFFKAIKNYYTNTKTLREIGDRQKVDEIRFRKAGMGALVKTYATDPTKAAIKVDYGPLVKTYATDPTKGATSKSIKPQSSTIKTYKKY